MESDLAALSGLKTQVLVRIQELNALTEEKEVVIERVRLGDFSSEPIDSEEAVEQVVQNLKEHLLELSKQRSQNNLRVIPSCGAGIPARPGQYRNLPGRAGEPVPQEKYNAPKL